MTIEYLTSLILLSIK